MTGGPDGQAPANPATAVTAATSTSDATIIARSWHDTAAFAQLYDRHAVALYRYAQRRLGADIAQEVVAETFLAAFAARTRYDPSRSDARPWLYGILTREIASHHRRETARLRALGRYAPDAPTDGPADRVAAGVSAQAARQRLAAALARLTAGERDVLLLYAWGDLSYDEIAVALNIPGGTVRSRLSRARRKTREALGTDPTDIIEE
jgi:RNA polymerase sigma factor (sigma-70 family)